MCVRRLAHIDIMMVIKPIIKSTIISQFFNSLSFDYQLVTKHEPKPRQNRVDVRGCETRQEIEDPI
jgi:hypothetical protein